MNSTFVKSAKADVLVERTCGVVGVGGVFDGKFGCEHWVSFFCV